MFDFYKNDLIARLFILGLILVVIICVCLGYLLDINAFLLNLFSGFAGGSISLLVGLFLIDSFASYRREKEWLKVRTLTLDVIVSHLNIIIDLIYTCFYTQEFPKRLFIDRHFGEFNKLDPETLLLVQSLPQAFLSSFDRKTGRFKNKNKPSFIVMIDFFSLISWRLELITSTLTPRVIQFSNNQVLLKALSEFDNAYSKLSSSVDICSQIGPADNTILEDLLEFLNVTADLYKIIYESLKE